MFWASSLGKRCKSSFERKEIFFITGTLSTLL